MTPRSGRRGHEGVIGAIVPDFRLMDVWPLPVTGRRDDFDRVVATIASFDPGSADSRVARTLFRVRHAVGARLGWDDPRKQRSIPGSSATTLRDRLPHELRATTGPSPGHGIRAFGFSPLFRTDEEWAAEISNDTVHGVMHVAWVKDVDLYRAELSVYVKPRGTLGRMYLALIQPFRHLIVYPALLRQVARAWDARQRTESLGG